MNAARSTDAEEFERRAVAAFCEVILTAWDPGDLVRRDRTRSTASADSYAYESVRRYGRPPETMLVLYFRDIARCQFLFGWRFAFWRYRFWRSRYWPCTDAQDEVQDEVQDLAQGPGFDAMPQTMKDDPESFGRWIAANEFLDGRDLDEATEPPYLPISENCNPDGVTWVRSTEGPGEDYPRPWLGPPKTSRFEARGDGG